MTASAIDRSLRRVVLAVALLNLGYFGVEFAVALAIGSVSLFADSVDFLEDASVNFLILAALGWTARNRARVGMLLAGIRLAPDLATLWTAWEKFIAPVPPEPLPLSLAQALRPRGRPVRAFMLPARYRSPSSAVSTRAAYLSARKDALANVGIVGAELVTGVPVALGLA